MGLDMYLDRRHYVKRWDFQQPAEQVHVQALKGGVPLPHFDPAKCKFLIEEVAYWRKANEVHGWFVDHVQDGVDDCREYAVSRTQLQDLRDRCARVLADPTLAEALLPTRSGFFFGSTEYDEWYHDALRRTVEQLDAVLAVPEAEDDGEYYYYSSW